MIGSPLAIELMADFRSPTAVASAEHFW